MKQVYFDRWQAVLSNYPLYIADCPGCGVGSVAKELTCTHLCGYIASPNYPALYPDSTTVTWNIQMAVDNYIELTFLEFHVESALIVCNEDYVDVFNKLRNGSKVLIGRYCLETQPPPSVFSSLNEMTIDFKSDLQYSNTGFFAQYSAKQYILPEYISKQIDSSGKKGIHLPTK